MALSLGKPGPANLERLLPKRPGIATGHGKRLWWVVLSLNCMGIARASRRPLRGLLSMTYCYGGIKKERHPEERPQGASRRTLGARPTRLSHYPAVETLGQCSFLIY